LSLRHEVVLEIEYLIKEIEALLRISLSNGFISEMNATLLLEEYKKTRERISHRNFVFSTDNTKLSKSFFLPKEGEAGILNSGGDESQNRFSNQYGNKVTEREEQSVKDSIKDNKQSRLNVLYADKRIKSVSDTKRHLGQGNKNSEKSERRDMILKIIRKNKNSTIKDISTMISGCSEKTIQRELLSLVSENILKKTGEKRWTRYFLA
jgi:hypothetical protein